MYFFQSLVDLYQEVTKFTSLGQALDLISAGIDQHSHFYSYSVQGFKGIRQWLIY